MPSEELRRLSQLAKEVGQQERDLPPTRQGSASMATVRVEPSGPLAIRQALEETLEGLGPGALRDTIGELLSPGGSIESAIAAGNQAKIEEIFAGQTRQRLIARALRAGKISRLNAGCGW
jgi:hypothetical protein